MIEPRIKPSDLGSWRLLLILLLVSPASLEAVAGSSPTTPTIPDNLGERLQGIGYELACFAPKIECGRERVKDAVSTISDCVVRLLPRCPEAPDLFLDLYPRGRFQWVTSGRLSTWQCTAIAEARVVAEHLVLEGETILSVPPSVDEQSPEDVLVTFQTGTKGTSIETGAVGAKVKKHRP